MKQPTLICAVVLLVGGCVAVPSQQVDFAYDPGLYSAYAKEGNAELTGQAFLRQQGGGVVVCAGELVLLLPAVGPFKQAVDLARSGVRPVAGEASAGLNLQQASIDPRYKDVVRHAQCDAQGNFRFAKLPAADWFLYTRVSWVVADVHQGGDLITEVDTGKSAVQQVLLTDNNRV